MNPLDTEVSYYPGGVWDILSTKTVNLYDYLTRPTPEQIAEVQAVRACPDPVKQKAMKRTVGSITPSGVFSPPREDANLVKHSGIITLDVDTETNPGLNFIEFRARVQSLDWVAACMLSIRGAGLAIYVPIEQPDKHRDHFRSLAADFAEMGVTVDPLCVNESRLRFNSCDPETYLNIGCTRYNRLATTSATGPRRANYTVTATPTDIFSWAAKLVERDGVTFADGYKHEFITRFSEILNRYGVPEAEVWDHVSANYVPRSEIRSNCISGPYRKYADEHGTRTFRLVQPSNKRTAVGESNLHFPKRHITPNLAADKASPTPEAEWQEVPAFAWELPEARQTFSDSVSTTELKHEGDHERLHEVEAPLHAEVTVPSNNKPEHSAAPAIALHEAPPPDIDLGTKLQVQNNFIPPTSQGRKTKAALLSQDRKLFIETPPLNNTFTVYSSVEAYNSRSERPQFIAKEALSGQSLTVVLIDLVELQIEGQRAPGRG